MAPCIYSYILHFKKKPEQCDVKPEQCDIECFLIAKHASMLLLLVAFILQYESLSSLH